MGQKLVKLAVKSDYRNRDVVYLEGRTIEVPEDEAAFLLRDAPDCFGKPKVARQQKPKAKPDTDTKEVEEPEVNKMVDEPEESKGDKKSK